MCSYVNNFYAWYIIIIIQSFAGNFKSKKAERKSDRQTERKTDEKTTKLSQDKNEKISEIPYILVMKYYAHS